jgi:DNA-directed RNA polymerase II subunit RPB2
MEQQTFEAWSRKVTKSFFDINSVTINQLHHYNEFIVHGIQQIFNEIGETHIVLSKSENVLLEFGNVFVGQPVSYSDRSLRKITPNEARLGNLTYESSVYVDIRTKKFRDDILVEEKVNTRVFFCKLPTMVGSYVCNLHGKTEEEKIKAGECRNDPLGYFIIKGVERVIVTLQRPNYNFVQVIEQTITNNTKYKYISEIRSVSEESGYSVLIQVMLGISNNEIMVSLPNIREAIPAGIVFKAMGFSTFEEMRDMIDNKYEAGKKLVKILYQSAAHIQTQEDAIKYISRYPLYAINADVQVSYARQIIEMEIFPHLGIMATIKDKATFLGYMINKLIRTHLEVRRPDDRDNISNKRFETTGILVGDLFKGTLTNFIKSLQKLVNVTTSQKKFDILSIIDSNKDTITKTIRTCFSTGNWSAKKMMAGNKVGVSQVLSRLTYIATLSHLRHIVIPIGKETKNTKIRQINTSQFGFICPSETPEGQTSGLVTNYALLAKVSKKTHTVIVKEFILSSKFTVVKKTDETFVPIMLNGTIIAFTNTVSEFVQDMISHRDNGSLDKEVSIIFDKFENELRMFCDSGRFMRPLLVVKDGKIYNGPETNWNNLIESGVIRFVDSNEIEQSVIAMFPSDLGKGVSYDFCEIDPASLLGIAASIIPFPDHSQSPRNCYQSSMGKQAIGVPTETFTQRADTSLYVMTYPQRPLVSTHFSNVLHANEMPSGANVVIAIMPKEGFNQEDSVCISKASIERGLFTVMSYFTITEEEQRTTSSEFQTIETPSINIRNSKNNYSFLDSNGIVKVGSRVKKDDVIVGKVLTKISKDHLIEKKDISGSIKAGEEGTVDSVKILATEKGWKLVKIVIRSIKIPEVGDKFASRAAQKGTCGMIFAQEDMPFTSDGITPDIIINPHCMPSRMTINQLLETILGKQCSISGTFGDASPFSSNSVDIMDTLCDGLENVGFDRYGQECMYNPYSGQLIDTKIFIGVAYYQRLKHMVSDKIHSRSKGHVTVICRQPLEGRSRDGGLRFGEMERDAMICHGNANFLKDRLFYMSDPYSVSVCSECGVICQKQCKICNSDKLCTVNLPYAAKLLFQELGAMCIKTELIPTKI